MRLPTLLLLLLAAGPSVGRAAAETYQFDPNHSSVAFTIRHFLAQIPGQFAKVSGTVTVDPTDFTRNTVEAAVEIASVTTNVGPRDDHLRSADFFDAAAHPTATFSSKSWVKTGPDTYDVTGTLTIHGVARDVTLPVTYLGTAQGNRGATLTGWSAGLKLKRADFGIGKPERAIGDEVLLTLNVEARLQKPETKTP
jgi:polyisoprenoid-binding protein YceI